jgi:hypothetical protein
LFLAADFQVLSEPTHCHLRGTTYSSKKFCRAEGSRP